MAVTPVTTDPSFGISYKNTVGVEELTVYQLLSNRDSLPIPTDENGNNPVFTEAVVTFEIKQANTDYSDQWTISEASSTDVTITVSSVAKTATVTAIAADVGQFTIAATRLGYPTIYRKINVFKSKAGTDGANAPDGETIVLDGSSNLKVDKFTQYDTTTLDDIILFGNGTVASGTTDVSYPSSSSTVISADSGGSVALTNVANSIIIGSDVVLSSNLLRTNVLTRLAVIGSELTMTPSGNISNAVMLATKGDTGYSSSTRMSNYSTSLGVSPINLVDNSTVIGYPRFSTEEHNSTYFVQGRDDATATTTPAVITVDLNDADIGGSDYVKVRADVYGVSIITATNYYTASSETTIVNGSVLADATTTAVLAGGDLASTAHANTFSGGVLTTTITPGGGASESYNWYVTYQITVIHR